MRARNMTLQDIATELGVAKSSVSLWVRDVPFTPSKRRTGPQRRPHPFHEAKLAQIAACDADGLERIGTLRDDAFLAAGVALYAGEGAKTDGSVKFANTDPSMIRFFCAWLRRYFEIDEARLRVRVYLHQGLDLDAAEAHWSEVTGDSARLSSARRTERWPIRASAGTSTSSGASTSCYACSTTHRRIMGLVRALLSSRRHSGVAQPAERSAVNRNVESSSLSPGAILFARLAGRVRRGLELGPWPDP